MCRICGLRPAYPSGEYLGRQAVNVECVDQGHWLDQRCLGRR
jgi:hypothetical protein